MPTARHPSSFDSSKSTPMTRAPEARAIGGAGFPHRRGRVQRRTRRAARHRASQPLYTPSPSRTLVPAPLSRGSFRARARAFPRGRRRTPESLGIREPHPRDVVPAKVLVSSLARGAAPTGPDVIDDDAVAGTESTLAVDLYDAPRDLMSGDVRQREVRGVRHLPADCLHVAETQPARDHLDEGIARRNARPGSFEKLEWTLVRHDAHCLHAGRFYADLHATPPT